MADLGNKQISTNYQRLLQISESGVISDGTGSVTAIRVSGSSNVGINHDPQPGISLFVDGTVSASNLAVDAGTIFIGDVTMSSNNRDGGGITFRDTASNEMGAFQGAGFFVLSSSVEEQGSSRPLFSLSQQQGSTIGHNVMQVDMTSLKYQPA